MRCVAVCMCVCICMSRRDYSNQNHRSISFWNHRFFLWIAAYSKCPNGCNGHGTCNIHDQCTCFNEDGQGVEYLASDEKIGATCFQHKTADPCNAITGTYACKFDTTANECKRIVKNEIVPSTVKQYPEWTGKNLSNVLFSYARR